MERNEGSIDRLIRFVAGLALLSLLFIGSPYRWVGWLGLIPLVTAVMGTCPIYRILHIQTCSRRKQTAAR